ncbi:MAG: T9SS type A sorting domain-containing protein [Candidatus Marinimicrobia bacterium]|nr:T9SS type A sorting domain-containing protein [Candidatus Neomarinimicrobiota bacterium]
MKKLLKSLFIFLFISLANSQTYENNFTHVWQDLSWGEGGYFPASSIISMEGPFDSDGDGQKEFLISSSWTGSIGNDMGIYEVVDDDSLELIWYVDLINYGINLPSNVSKATTADLDNDGLLEILLIIDVSPDNLNDVGDQGTGYDSFSVWEFDSTTGSFPSTPTTTWDMAASDVIEVGEIAVDDIDGDGVQEVAVSLTTGWDESTGLLDAGRFMIFSLDQSTTLESALWNIELLDLSSTVAPGYLTRITDLDNDGSKEVVFVAWEWFRIIIYEALIGDVYINVADFTVANQATHFCSGGAFEANFDEDGTNELYFVTTQSYASTIPYEDGHFYVLTNDGDISQVNFDNNVHWLYSFPESSFGYDMRGLVVGNQDSPLGQNPDGPDIYIAGGWTGNIYDFEYTGGDITDPNNYSLDTLWSAPNYGSNDSWFRPSRIVTGFFDEDSLGDILIASMDYDNFNAPHVVWLEHDYEFVGIDDKNSDSPLTFEISSIYPNPFNPITRIDYAMTEPGYVNMNIYDIQGKLVREFSNEFKTTGLHTLQWNAENDQGEKVPSGVYFVTLHSENKIASRKILLMK